MGDFEVEGDGDVLQHEVSVTRKHAAATLTFF
jgi:hypothetical protein